MKILLVKLSSLGDVVHTLPVVQDLRAAIPNAQIDWVVEQAFAPVLAHAVGLGQVIACDIRRWRQNFWTPDTRAAWRRFKTQLQAQTYDAVIDLQGLTKSALVARLARLAPGGKRYALANQTHGSSYEAPTRWLADVAVWVAPHSHAVQRGRALCAGALGYALAPTLDFGFLPPPYVPQDSAQDTPQKTSPTVLLVHGTSRADKQWPLTSWLDLARHLLAAGYAIALPHGNAAELALSEQIAQTLAQPGKVTVWPRLPLNLLAQRMAACYGVVGVDSGLSHMAVALGLPHVQIYNFNTAWRTGPYLDLAHLPDPASDDVVAAPVWQVSVVEQPTPQVATVWQAWQACCVAHDPTGAVLPLPETQPEVQTDTRPDTPLDAPLQTPAEIPSE